MQSFKNYLELSLEKHSSPVVEKIEFFFFNFGFLGIFFTIEDAYFFVFLDKTESHIV